MALNIREIARQLDLSPATVSKAMRGHSGEVSIDTAKKVLNYCQQQGYITRTEASGILMKMRTLSSRKQIFVLSCYRGIEVYDATFAGICEHLQDHRLYSNFYVAGEPSSMAHFPYEQAAVVIVLGRVHKEAIEQFIEKKISIVLVDNRISGAQISAVNSDNLEGVFDSTQTLINHGHKRVAFLCSHEDETTPIYTFQQRQAGYMAAMANNGLTIEPSWIAVEYGSDKHRQYKLENVVVELEDLAQRLLNVDPLPTAVVAANDWTAYVLREAAIKRGLKVPQDLSIIGYDGLHALSNRPTGFAPVSTRLVKWQEMGKASVDLALEMFSASEHQAKYLQIPTTYEDAGTVAPPQK